MDTIGFGDSYKPKKTCTIEDYAKGVIAFLDSLGIPKVVLVGHHTGGVIALEVAAGYPERVEMLVLSAIPYVDEEDGRLIRVKGERLTPARAMAWQTELLSQT